MNKFYLLFISYTISSCAVAQWNSNTLDNLEVAALQSSDIYAAATSDGGTWIAWFSQNGSNFDMRAQLLNAQGIKQLGTDGILVSNIPTGSATFVFNAVVDKSNNFIIAFQDQRMGSNGAVIYKVNTDGSLPWGSSGIYLGPGLSPYPAVLSNGEILVAWNNSSNRISYQKITTAGTAAWSPAKEMLPIISGRAISRVQVVPHTLGKFGMVIQQRNGTTGSPTPTTLYEQQFDNDGVATWLAPIALTNYVTSNSRYYSVLSFDDTTYIGYYANPSLQNRFDAFLQKVNGDGSLPWGINGSDFATDPTPYEMVINIAHDPTTSDVWAVCTYSNSLQSQYGIFAQKFNATTGARQLTDNAKSVFAINANSEQQRGILALSNNQPMFMFYDITNKIFASKLNSTGDFAWAANKVELGSTTNSKLRYNFTTATTGQAVAVWQENKGAQDRAYAQNITSGGNTGPQPIPVTLTDLFARQEGKFNHVYWKTQTESNNRGFYVERSADAGNFTALDFVATRSSGGNSSNILDYSFIDILPLSGRNYYRLKQEDKDGHFVFSNIVLVKMNYAPVYLQSLYPNPAGQVINLSVNADYSTSIREKIMDLSGRVLLEQNNSINPGNNQIQLNLSRLAPGFYQLKMSDNKTNETRIYSFVKN